MKNAPPRNDASARGRPAKALRALLLCAFLLPACSAAWAGQETVHFTTSDGCRIEAFWLAPSSGAYVLINTHGLGSDKNEWGSFQDALRKRGLGYFSLDLRGHGKSLVCGGKAVDYRKFTLEDWSAASRDIEAAAAWLKKRGYPARRMIFCGASVGANLSLKAAAEGRIKPAALILLSPGMEYAGIKAEDYLARAPKKILLGASENDPYAWQSVVIISELAGKYHLNLSAIDGGGGHGVNMFKTPGVMDKVLDWLPR